MWYCSHIILNIIFFKGKVKDLGLSQVVSLVKNPPVQCKRCKRLGLDS